MPTLRLPTGATILPPQPFSRELLTTALKQVCAPRRDVTGLITIGSDEDLYLLFLFQGRPYAAGTIVADKPATLPIREFLLHAGQLADAAATLAIHACDPVLLKSLLIFIQEDPTAKAPANLINLEAILDQIRQDGEESLIILQRQQMLNLFYFRDGKQGMAYFSDPDFPEGEGLPFDEQMLVYAFQPDAAVTALVYRNPSVSEAADTPFVGTEWMLRLLKGESETASHPVEEQCGGEAVADEGDIVLEILNGPQQGQRVHGPIPCVIGREGSDIIVADPMVSPRHAAVQPTGDGLTLADLNSSAGTTLNGTHVVQSRIAEGDVIGLGATALKVVRLASH
jgi:hypothetical protein